MSRQSIPNVLAARYASAPMTEIWAPWRSIGGIGVASAAGQSRVLRR